MVKISKVKIVSLKCAFCALSARCSLDVRSYDCVRNVHKSSQNSLFKVLRSYG